MSKFLSKFPFISHNVKSQGHKVIRLILQSFGRVDFDLLYLQMLISLVLPFYLLKANIYEGTACTI